MWPGCETVLATPNFSAKGKIPIGRTADVCGNANGPACGHCNVSFSHLPIQPDGAGALGRSDTMMPRANSSVRAIGRSLCQSSAKEKPAPEQVLLSEGQCIDADGILSACGAILSNAKARP